MNAMDILAPYANRPTSTEADFDEVAPQVSPEALGDGIAHAFRSEQTPAFGSMVQQLFGAEAAQVTPEQVREIAEQAEKADPSVLDLVGSFYAKHPDVVKMLGGAALAIALGRIAKRSPR